jgi:glyoxylase-like metal-dependent hydrolase (beta-lactamase superfamily II)
MVKLRAIVSVLAFVIVACFSIQVGARPGAETSSSSPPTVTGKVYRFDKIAEGVYYATTVSEMITGGNHPIIINENDVVLVDDGTTVAAARALLTDLKLLTNKPVRWVVNTHWHYDHLDGNSVFGSDVQIIGHHYVRYALLNLDVLPKEIDRHLEEMPGQMETLKKQIGGEKDPKRRAVLEKQRAAIQAALEELKVMKPPPPTMTYSSKMTIYRGQREIQLLFLGRGHTEGDTVVFLPKERIVCAGDLMESKPSVLVNGVFDEWITTLDALKKLDFDTVLPGHGEPFHGTSLITAFQDYLRDLIAQVASFRKQGFTAEQTAKKVDLTSHKADFPQIQGPGVDVVGVQRVYEWMDERAKR